MAASYFHGLQSLKFSSRDRVCFSSGWHGRRDNYFVRSCIKKPEQVLYLDFKIIYLGKPDGPTCHTGADTCYYTSVFDSAKFTESTIAQRKEEISVPQTGKPSWTRRLLLDNKLLGSMIREEADELCRTSEENEDVTRTASEMGDVLNHAMVLLAVRGVKVEEVLSVFRHRFTQSGVEEKESRKAKD